MLKRMGGAGTINPMTGLPEFYEGSDWSEGVGDSTSTDTGSNEGLSDEDNSYQAALDAAEAEAAMDIYESDEPGITFGGGIPGEGLSYSDLDTARSLAALSPEDIVGLTYGFGSVDKGIAGAQAGFKGFGDVDLAFDTQGSIAAVRDKFNKEGIPQEYWPYYNSLKARGLSNEEAIAALAAAAGTPSGATALSSGYRDSYQFGSPMGTLESIFADRMSAINEAAARERGEAAKERSESDDLLESEDYVEDPGFFGRIGDVLSSLNPLGELTPEEQAVLQSHRDAGFLTDVRERSTMDNLLGFAANLAMPGPLSAVKFVGEKATGANIIGLATDPATGFDYLVQANGDLQLAPGLGDLSPQDDGNPFRDKKRVTSSEPKKEEEEEKEEVTAAEEKEIKPSAYQVYLDNLLYPDTQLNRVV
jgi:hypothetical protein